MQPNINHPEEHNAKVSALVLLSNLGWTFLSPEQVLVSREGKMDQVILRQELRSQLQKRTFTFASKIYPLSEKSIDNLISEVCNPALNEGLLRANERLYNQLLHGISVSEIVGGKEISPTIALIDWHNPANNSYLLTEGLTVNCKGGIEARHPAIVCFVNGIPLAVIEAKQFESDPVPTIAAGIAQSLRNQHSNEIPQLFAYSQLVVAISGKDACYGTCGMPAEFWARWCEEDISCVEMFAFKNKNLNNSQFSSLSALRFENDKTAITLQDQLLIGLLKPERLLEITRFFSLFDHKLGRLVAGYQQVFGIKRVLERVNSLNPAGGHEGGVVWCGTGSGESLAIALLGRVLILQENLTRCRIVIVSEKQTLENLLSNAESELAVWKNRDVSVATSGRRLAAQIGKGAERIVLSPAQKFKTAITLPECKNTSADLIVVIDDSFPWWKSENQRRLKRILPKACFFVVTSRPLANKEEIARTFGPVVYSDSLQNAIADKAGVPPLDETRFLHEPTKTISGGYAGKSTTSVSFGVHENIGVYTTDKSDRKQGAVDRPDDSLNDGQDLLCNESPDVFGGNRCAQAYFCVLKKVLLKTAVISDSLQNAWVKLALEIDDVVATAEVKHSINRQDAVAEIRKNLLPKVFRECKAMGGGLEQAKGILDRVLEVSR